VLQEWLELGIRLVPGSIDNLFIGGFGGTARIQLIGAGEKSGPKFAIYGAAMQMQSSAHGDQNGSFGAGGYDWKASSKATVLSAGTSLGYRFDNPGLLIFIAEAYADQSVSGSITHDLSSNGTSPAASYSLADVKGNTRTTALGARLGSTVQVGVEARLINRSWPAFSAPATGGGVTNEATYALSLYFPH
jgi:hypothetical protein